MKFVADDGTIFNTLEECTTYEELSMKDFKLTELVACRLETTYCEDLRCGLIEQKNVIDFIQDNWDELCKLMPPPKMLTQQPQQEEIVNYSIPKRMIL